MPLWLASILLVASFIVLAKGADWLVDGAVGLADSLGIPKLIIGIVLVSMATTAPELTVSVLSALSGRPEMALGNAVGSVIVDNGVAMALIGLLAAAPVAVSRSAVIPTMCFLVALVFASFLLAFDGVLTRAEGAVLLAGFIAYMSFLVVQRLRSGAAQPEVDEIEEKIAGKPIPVLGAFFIIGVVMVIGASHVAVDSAVVIARGIGIPEIVVALTLVAFGTSVPEIATCVASVRRGHGTLAVGNVLGADILNISWIAGASAMVNPLVVSPDVVYFMFPSMIIIVMTMVVGLLWKQRMGRGMGALLMAQYAIYLAALFVFFPPNLG